MSLFSTPVKSISSELPQTRDRSVLTPHRLRQTWEKKPRKKHTKKQGLVIFTYLFFATEADSLECQCMAQQRLTDVGLQ